MLDFHEQEIMLKRAGFVDVLKTEVLYGKSAILNSAYKKWFLD